MNPNFISDYVYDEERFDTRWILATGGLFAALLFFLVPVLTLTMQLHVFLMICAASIGYGLVLCYYCRIVEGMISAAIILVTFKADFPIIAGPFGTELRIMLADVIVVPLLVLLLTVSWSQVWEEAEIYELVIGTSLCFLTFWSLAAALFGAGESTFAGYVFAAVQFRFLLVFLLGYLIVKKIGVIISIYTIGIAIIGHLLFAIGQLLNQQAFGLTQLGEGTDRFIAQEAFGPLIIKAGLYAGGFTGSSRVLVGMVILFTPAALYISLAETERVYEFIFFALLGAIVLRGSKTDAGLGAYLLTLFLCSLVVFQTTERDLRQLFYRITTANSATLFTLLLFYRRFRISEPSTSESEIESSPASEEAGSSPSAEQVTVNESNVAGGVENGKSLPQIPFLDTSTLPVRFKQYTEAIKIGLTNPLFGLGGYNFRYASSPYGVPRGMDVHNTFFAYLAATGVPGALSLLTAIITIVFLLIQRFISTMKPQRVLWGLLVCSVIGFQAYTFWTRMWDQPSFVLFWMFTGIIVGADSAMLADESHPTFRSVWIAITNDE